MKIHLIKNSHNLYLDRDGVINEKIDNDYVKNWDEFIFINESLMAISILSEIFNKIFIVTNQRGIGKGIMTTKDLKLIHDKMMTSKELNDEKDWTSGMKEFEPHNISKEIISSRKVVPVIRNGGSKQKRRTQRKKH